LAATLTGIVSFAAMDIRTYEGGLDRWLLYQRHKSRLTAAHKGARVLDEGYRAIRARGAGPTRTSRRQAGEVERVTAWLDENVPPGGALLGYPDLGIFNYFSDRPHATRFTIPILAAANESWSREIGEDLASRRPPVVLVGLRLSTLARATQRKHEYLPELREQIRRDYVHATTIGRIEIYVLPEGG